MFDDTFGLHPGMAVLTSDEEHIGTVGHVFSAAPGTPASRDVEVDAGRVVDAGSLDPDVEIPISERPISESASGSMASGAITGFTPAANLAGGVAIPPSTTKYFEVRHGGILGLGQSSYFVPFSAVQFVVPGENVTLSYTKDTVIAHYGDKPASLDPADGLSGEE